MILFTAVALLLLAGVIALIPLGLRAGDRCGDVVLLTVDPEMTPRGAAVTVSNPGAASVIFGMSLRPPARRLRLEGGSYVRIRTGRTTADLRAGRQTRIAVLDAGETETFVVPAGPQIPERAELVVVVGQPERLRTIHRLLALPLPGDHETRHQIGEAGLQPLER